MRRGEKKPISKDPVISFLIQNTIHFFTLKSKNKHLGRASKHLGCEQTALHRGGGKTTPKSMKSRKKHKISQRVLGVPVHHIVI